MFWSNTGKGWNNPILYLNKTKIVKENVINMRNCHICQTNNIYLKIIR